MSSVHSILQGVGKCRRFCFGVGLALSRLPAVHSHGQETITSDNESRRSAGDDALVPLTSGPPLTAREEEMLRLIKGLQERVAHLEALEGSNAGDVQPAAQGDYQRSSQARLWKHRLFPSPRTDGGASLAVPTFHAGVNGAISAGGATIKNPFENNGGQDA